MNKEQQNVLNDAINYYEKMPQTIKAIEEMAELTKALAKAHTSVSNGTYHEFTKAKEEILEEKADVYIMLAQLDMIFGESNHYIDEKIERLRQRMNETQAGSDGSV